MCASADVLCIFKCVILCVYVLYLVRRSLVLLRLQYSFVTFIKRIIIIQSMFITFYICLNYVNTFFFSSKIEKCWFNSTHLHSKTRRYTQTHTHRCKVQAYFSLYHFTIEEKNKLSNYWYSTSVKWDKETNHINRNICTFLFHFTYIFTASIFLVYLQVLSLFFRFFSCAFSSLTLCLTYALLDLFNNNTCHINHWPSVVSFTLNCTYNFNMEIKY